MPEKFGIENLKKVLAFGITFGKYLAADLKDSKITFSEVLQLVLQLSSIPELLVQKDAIIAEAKDLSIDEIKVLVQSVEGAINDQKVTDVIEHSLSVIVSVAALIQDFKKPVPPAL